jgi:membrane protein required for colicin V production
MKTLDIVLLVLLLLGTWQGYRRGLLLEILSLLAFLAATLLALNLRGWGTDKLSPLLGKGNYIGSYLSFMLIFTPTLFLLNRLAFLLRANLRHSLLGNFDRLGGAILGLFAYALLISSFLWMLDSFSVLSPEAKKDTKIYPVVAAIAPQVFSKLTALLPPGDQLLDELRKRLSPPKP